MRKLLGYNIVFLKKITTLEEGEDGPKLKIIPIAGGQCPDLSPLCHAGYSMPDKRQTDTIVELFLTILQI